MKIQKIIYAIMLLWVAGANCNNSAFSMATGLFDGARTLGNTVSAAVLNRVHSVTENPIVQRVGSLHVDSTSGFKASVALLGLWSIPLIYNLARWQWKKAKVKRKIGVEPSDANIRAFHANRVQGSGPALSGVFRNEAVLQNLPSTPRYVAQPIVDLIGEYDVGSQEQNQQEIESRTRRDLEDVTYQPLMPNPVPWLETPANLMTGGVGA